MANANAQGNTIFTTERKKADAWLNISLPVTNADNSKGTKKLGGIPLDKSDPLQAKLIEVLQGLTDTKDIHEVVSTFISQGEITFVVPQQQGDFKLG